MARRGPKSWTSKRAKPSYARPARSTVYRKTARPAAALSGMKTGVPKAASVHRFTRWGPQQTLVSYSTGGGSVGFQVLNGDGGAAQPITVGSAVSDPSGTALYGLGGTIQFQLKDLPSYTDFTALFDHYTIEQIDIEVNDTHNSAASAGTSSAMPTITYAPDFDDSGVPANESEISQYQRAKTHTFRGDGKPLKFSIKPRVAVPVYRAALTTGYMAGPEGARLDLAYTDLLHYGVKFWLNQLSGFATDATGSTRLTWKMKYHLKMMDPK